MNDTPIDYQDNQNPFILPQNRPNLHLEKIKGINFTRREIDVLACMLSGKTAKKIASLLSIAPKTVESHIRNIILKLSVNSQNEVIDFIEQSHQFSAIRSRYTELLLQLAFETSLRKISVLIQPADFNVKKFLVYEKDPLLSNKVLEQFESIFKLLKLPVSLQEKTSDLEEISKSPSSRISVYLLSESSEALQGIRFKQYSDFYTLAFAVLTQLIPNIHFSEIISDFKIQSQHCPVDNLELLSLKLNNSQALQTHSQKTKIHSRFQISFQNKKHIVLIILALVFLGYFFSQTVLTTSSQMAKTSLHWNFPREDHLFIGRADWLQALHKDCSFQEKNSSPDSIVSVCSGLGGVGKTQLALHYANLTKSQYSLTAWFSAENLNNLNQQYIKFAKALGCEIEDSDIGTIFAYVKDYLAKHPGFLLIFDNVSHYSKIQDFLPEQGGHVIITTRHKDWPSKFKVHPIEPMNPSESINLLQSLIKRPLNNEKEAAEQLGETLGYLPLALTQAGTYIEQNHITIQDYLELYRKYELELLSKNTLPGNYPNTITVTWNVTLNALLGKTKESNANTSPLSLELLYACAYLAPEKISKSFLLQWLKNIHPEISLPELALNQSIHDLWQFSLINQDEEGHISLHRLLQAVIRHQHREIKDPGFIPSLSLNWYDSLLNALHQQFQAEAPPLVQEQRQRELLGHLQTLIHHRDPIWPEQFSEPFAELLLDLGSVLHKMGDPKASKIFYERVLSLYTKKYGKNHQRTALALRYLGDIYTTLGKPHEARQYLEDSLAIQKKYSPCNSFEIAITLACLADACGDLGHATQKKALLEEALLKLGSDCPREHPYKISILYGLARTHTDLGNFKQSELLFDEVISLYKKRFGDQHPKLATALHNAANNHLELGNFKKASTLFKQALAINKHCYGPEHTKTAIILHGLGRAYLEQSNFHAAKNLLEKALIIRQQHYGNQHRQTAMVYYNLGRTFHGLHNLEKSEELLNLALQIHESYYGKNHPKVAMILCDLGSLYTDQNKLEKAQPILEQALAIQKQYYGPQHIKTSKCLFQLARLHKETGNSELAQAFNQEYSKVLELHQFSLSQDSSH